MNGKIIMKAKSVLPSSTGHGQVVHRFTTSKTYKELLKDIEESNKFEVEIDKYKAIINFDDVSVLLISKLGDNEYEAVEIDHQRRSASIVVRQKEA